MPNYDAAWLKSIGFQEGEKFKDCVLGPLHIHLGLGDCGTKHYACIRSLPIPTPETKEDVLTICRLLGITSKPCPIHYGKEF